MGLRVARVDGAWECLLSLEEVGERARLPPPGCMGLTPFPPSLPPPLLTLAAGQTVVWDPRGERQQEWAKLEGDKDALAAAVERLPAPATVRMQPWNVMFMKNPVPHMVR